MLYDQAFYHAAGLTSGYGQSVWGKIIIIIIIWGSTARPLLPHVNDCRRFIKLKCKCLVFCVFMLHSTGLQELLVYWSSIYTATIKPTRCTNFSNLFLEQKLYMFRTVPLSIIRSFSLYTQQWYMSCRFADSSQAVIRTVWHIPLLCVQWKTPDDGQRNCPKHVEFLIQK